MFGFPIGGFLLSLNMNDSQQLLRQYRETGSESAFRELVDRYVNLVYSTALRSVGGDAHRAQDVGQIVFADLARKASKISPDVMLGGWLHRHTCFTAANVMRGERRRQVREQQAMEMKAMHEETAPDFSQIAPVLDDAINALGDEDRAAILLRFFEQRDFRTVAERLGINEDTARMRVRRALEKLESLLKRKGIITTASALGIAVSTHAIQAAPTGFAAVAATAALAGTTAAATTAAVTKAIAMTTLQKTMISFSIAAALGVSLYEAIQVSQLRQQLTAAQQKQSLSDGELQRLQSERDDAQKKLTALQLEMGRGQKETIELAKLRSEVTRLRGNSTGSTSRNTVSPETPTAEAARLWLQRVALLRQRLDQWPVKTPELELLTEQDWLNEVADHDLDSEEQYRESMARLRFTAKTKFAKGIEAALKQFSEANKGRLPRDLSEFQTWLQPSMLACLPNYEIAPPGAVKPPQPSSPNSQRAETWALVEKGSLKRDDSGLADPEYDTHIVIYDGGYYGYGPSRKVP